MTPSPRPWQVAPMGIIIRDPLGQHIAYTTSGGGILALRATENAAHIVHCVNAHEDLVTALRALLERVLAGESGTWTAEDEAAITQARGLLARLNPAATAE